jgi:hypothetical protein
MLPSDEQAEYLLQTLVCANAACQYISDYAHKSGTRSKYKLQRAFALSIVGDAGKRVNRRLVLLKKVKGSTLAQTLYHVLEKMSGLLPRPSEDISHIGVESQGRS